MINKKFFNAIYVLFFFINSLLSQANGSSHCDGNYIEDIVPAYVSTEEDVVWQFVVEASYTYSNIIKIKLTQQSLDEIFDSIGDGTLRALVTAKMGLGIDQISSSGDSFLVAAIKKNNFKLAALIVKKCTNINYRIKSGDTALDLANRKKQNEITALLRKHGAKTGEELKAEGK